MRPGQLLAECLPPQDRR